MMSFLLHRNRFLWLTPLLAFGVAWVALPPPQFDAPYSTVLIAENGTLLGARIAADGQWRFPPVDSVPEKFRLCIESFEDKRFRYHPGVDPLAMGRAMWQNLTTGQRISGASTLTMQTVRLSRNQQARSLGEKLREVLIATRFELAASKDEILQHYASHAPFGANIVGLNAAAWKYFNRPPSELSWAENAMLAVLPNAPSLLHLSKRRKELKAKRDRLLERLHAREIIDAETYELALVEPLPERPLPLPSTAPHLLDRITGMSRPKDAVFHSSIDANLQRQCNAIVARQVDVLRGMGIHNGAALVCELSTGKVRAYVGNASYAQDEHGSRVDMITAPRSSGSILKPFLYAFMLNDGQLLPDQLVTDIPTTFGHYKPMNYDEDFDGAVPASAALSRSLNVPMARMLSEYGQPKFYELLKAIGMTTLSQPADHYGLSLILGGAETTLWDLAAMYGGMGRNLLHFDSLGGTYDRNSFRHPNLAHTDMPYVVDDEDTTESTPISAAAAWFTLKAMLNVERPFDERYWRNFSSAQRIAWKTGTSYGFRDAWAVGLNTDYVVCVWVGNADGEGRPGLVGQRAAAPILFRIFDVLRAEARWFEKPTSELARVQVSARSGFRSTPEVPDAVWREIPKSGLRTPGCPYHKRYTVDLAGKYRMHADCAPPDAIQQKAYFVLPPVQAYYYKRKHPNYDELPPYRPDCREALADIASEDNDLQLAYPKPGAEVLIPRDLDGQRGKMVCSARHRDENATIFWHLDEKFIGTTQMRHNIELSPDPGPHTLTLTDHTGARVQVEFRVLGSE